MSARRAPGVLGDPACPLAAPLGPPPAPRGFCATVRAMSASPTSGSGRTWLLRGLAVALGVGLVGLVELSLRVAGVTPGGTWEPPRLVQIVENGQVSGGFTVRATPHWVEEPLADGAPGFRTAELHRRGKGGGFPVGGSMRDVHVAAEPAPGVERYVLLGGSAALGLRAMGPASRNVPSEPLPSGAAAVPLRLAISGQLEEKLAAQGVQAEVVNAGMIAQDSSAVRVIAEESLALKPTGLLLYLGNNEGIGMAWAMRDMDLPEVVPAVRGALRHSRIYRVLAGFIVEQRQRAQPAAQPSAGGKPRRPSPGGQMEIGPEVLARIGRAQWASAGVPLVEGDRPTDTVHAAMLTRLEENLAATVRAAQAQGVTVTIIPTPTHLTYKPFAVSSDPGVSAGAVQAAQRSADQAEAARLNGDVDEAVRLARAAVRQDSGSAGAWYQLGMALGARGDHADAVRALEASVARDLSRKRTQPAFASVAERVCRELGCRTTSAHAALTARARQEGIAVYDEILGDHEHLNPPGNAWVADLFASLLLEDR